MSKTFWNGIASFKEIAHEDKLDLQMPADSLMEKLIQGFFRGEFERDGKSLLFRTDLPPLEQFSSKEGETIGFDSPGRYKLGGDGHVKEINDKGESENTGDLPRFPIERHDFIWFSETPLPPSWWNKTSEEVGRLAYLKIGDWPPDMRGYFDKMCIEKADLEAWLKGNSIKKPVNNTKTASKKPFVKKDALKIFAEELRKNDASPPTQSKFAKLCEKKFPDNRVKRDWTREVHKKIFNTSPGPRKEVTK